MSEFLERIATFSPKRLALLADSLQARLEEQERGRREPIAIIGLSCRFPGAANPEAFWELLRQGQDAITEVPPRRWNVDSLFDPSPDAPGKMYVRHGGFLDGLDLFDPQVFGIAPREALSMDPQQRLLLEVAWEALENAGQAPPHEQGSPTGVFIGIGASNYTGGVRLNQPHLLDPYSLSGNIASVAVGRLSHVLGLQGPSFPIDTACSSSLVAVHQACRSLRVGECRMALAGGVNLILAPEATIYFCKVGLLSRQGHCRTFDAAADGYVRGEGCGIVVLKRLSDAQADGDPILAVIRGSAVNHNGRGAGLMVPSSTAQEAVIRLALAEAGVKPEAVGFIEGQGTATLLGDSVELRTLAALFGKDRLPGRPLYLGSVKTNVGHLEVAAGMAGLIKTVLALRHRAIPPNLHFQQPNPHLAWQETPLQVPTALLPWMQENGPRVAGVSAFSFSGTNAHVVLEEAPSCPAPVQTLDRPVHLLCLSARTPAALKQLAAAVGENLSAPTAGKLPDASFTVNCGRRHFPHRVAVVADEQMKAARALALFAGGAQVEGVATSQVTRRGAPRIALLFSPWISGNWSPGAGRQLFQTCPPFRNALQEIAALADPLSGRSLLSDMYPEPAGGASTSHPPMSLVARFALQVALVRLWRGWGIQPTLYVGHGLSAYAAAAAAGVFRLVDGLRLALLLEQGLSGNPPERLVQPLPESVVTSLGRVTAEIALFATRRCHADWHGRPVHPSRRNDFGHVLGEPGPGAGALWRNHRSPARARLRHGSRDWCRCDATRVLRMRSCGSRLALAVNIAAGVRGLAAGTGNVAGSLPGWLYH